MLLFAVSDFLSGLKIKSPAFKNNAPLFLPTSVQVIIVKKCNLQCLLALSNTCRFYYHFIQCYIHGRTQNLISKFDISPERLLHIMGYYGAIIGGSCALSSLYAAENTFQPIEITVYLPAAYRNTLTASLFQHLLPLGSVTAIGYNPLISLVEWYACCRPNTPPLHVIAVFTTTNNPIQALFHCQYTITLNAITSRGIFSAYRSLTLLGRSLVRDKPLFPSPVLSLKSYINPFGLCHADRHAILGAFGIALPYWTVPPFLFFQLGMEYKARNIFFTQHLSNIPGFHDHQCHSEFSCPTTARTMADPGCLFFPFSKFERLPIIPEDGKIIPVIPPISNFTTFKPTLAPNEIIVWFFGGEYGCTSMSSTFPRVFGAISPSDLMWPNLSCTFRLSDYPSISVHSKFSWTLIFLSHSWSIWNCIVQWNSKFLSTVSCAASHSQTNKTTSILPLQLRNYSSPSS